MRSIPARPTDTTVEADRVQIDLLRAAPVARRLRIAMSLTATVISAARRGLDRTHPRASRREQDLRFVELHYGPSLADALRADLIHRELDRRDPA